MWFGTKNYTLLAQKISKTECRLAELVDLQHQLHKVLAQQQAQVEQERDSQRESMTSLLAEMHELVSLQQSQKELSTVSAHETHSQLDQLRSDLNICTQRIERLEAGIAHMATRLQVLETWALEWQQQVATNEQRILAALTFLQEEAQAKETALGHEAGGIAKATQRPRKSVKSNGASVHREL
jgi:TolA-binding protein